MLYFIYTLIFSMTFFLESYGGGFYEINPEKIDHFRAVIENSTTVAATEFKNVIERSFRDIRSPENYTSKPDFWGIFNDIREKNGMERDVSKARAAINAAAQNNGPLTYEKELEIAASCFDIEKQKEDFLSGIHNMRSQEHDRYLESYRLYQEKYSHLGKWRLSTLRNFINKQLLKIGGNERIYGDETLFQLMKKEGLITTKIPTLKGYTYSQSIAAKEFLQNHPEIHTLVLGCGSFIPYQLAVPFLGRAEGGCASCQGAHHISKGEMTVSFLDNPEYIKNDDYNEEGAACDIVGDLRSLELWTGIHEGLGNKKFKVIADHTHYAISVNSECLGHIYGCLVNKGLFEVNGTLDDAQITIITQKGFSQKDVTKANELPLYQFQKN